MNVNVMGEPIETIHLYVVREEEKKPFVFLPVCAALLCLACIVGLTAYSALHPTYEHETLSIPAHFLPLQTFTATQVIIPAGIQTYPATTAHGILTLTNGSVVTEQLPQGMIFTSRSGIEVITDSPVLVPAGNASTFGMSTVPAHLLASGINMSRLDIDQVLGTSVYIRNLYPFTGGKPAYSIKVVTPQDKQTALGLAKAAVSAQQARIPAMLAKPCSESVSWSTSAYLSWRCQFVAYLHLPGVQITAIRLRGKNLLVDVVFVAHPTRRWAR